MRDQKRIHRICNIFERIWNQFPDERFGQLISNMIGEIANDHEVRDIFFPEDDEWEKWLQEYSEKYKWS